jgi:putative transposase
MIFFKKGQVIWRDDIEWEVVRASNDEVLIEHRTTGVREQAKPMSLLLEYVGHRLKVAQDKHQHLSTSTQAPASQAPIMLSEAARIETMRRLDYITRLEREGAFGGSHKHLREQILKVSVERGEQRAPHYTTVYRWHRRFVHALRQVNGVLARFDSRGGKDGSRLDPVVEGIIHDKIETVFLAAKTGSAEEVLNAVCLEINRLNQLRVQSEQLKGPGLRTIQRRLASLYAYELAVARFGEREAERRFAKNLGARPVSRILEIVEIDHSPIDCLVVNEDRVVIGRPWITVVLDRSSRCVLGFHLSLAGHGTEAVFETLRTAMLPKEHLTTRYADLGLEWGCFGWPERVVMDNGREFHADAVVQALLDVGVIGEYSASKDPNDKPHVERFLKTLNYTFIHRLPGTTLAKVHQRIGFKAEDEACLTLEELDRMIHTWICQSYHLRPHGGLSDQAPIAVWQRSAEQFPPQLKMNASDLEIAFCQSTTSAVQNDGIDLNTFKYVSAELLNLRRMLPVKARVDVKWPTHDAGHLWVWHDLDKRYLRVPNKDESLVGLTVEQAKSAKKELAKPHSSYRAVAATAGEVVRGMSEAAMEDKKLKVRRKAAKDRNMTSKDARGTKVPVERAQSPAGDADFLEESTDLMFDVETVSTEEVA